VQVIHEKELCVTLVIYKDYTEMHGQQNAKNAKMYEYILFFVCVHSRVMAVVVSERVQCVYADTNPTFLIIIKRETSDLKDPRN